MSVAKYKVVLLGNSSVGKTSILYRIKNEKFKEDQDSTIGCEFFAHDVDVGTDKVKLLLWDTAGQEVFRAFTKNFLRGAKLVIIVYDVTSLKSFDDIADWINEVKSAAIESRVIVVGNKADLNNVLDIDPVDILSTLKNYYDNIDYFGTVSSKTGHNISEFFEYVSRSLLNSQDGLNYDDDMVNLNNSSKSKNKTNKCCS